MTSSSSNLAWAVSQIRHEIKDNDINKYNVPRKEADLTNKQATGFSTFHVQTQNLDLHIGILVICNVCCHLLHPLSKFGGKLDRKRHR